jgi:hypothetical protein
MGVYVHLGVVASRVDEASWSAIYADARRVAERWTPRPLGIQWRRIGAEEFGQYTTDIERPEGLHIVGDAASLTTAESFEFPKSLTPRFFHDPPRESKPGDILVAVASYFAGRRSGPDWRELFGNKTQGRPYHEFVVALGLLVEHRLPSTALVYGDLSIDDGETARRRLTEILGESFELPVVTDPARLRARLAVALEGDELEEAVRSLEASSSFGDALASDLLGAMLSGSTTSQVHHDLEHVAPTCDSPARLHEPTRQFLAELLTRIREYVQSTELREQLAQRDRVQVHEEIARSLSRRFRLTSTAWDAIESADVDDLAFTLAAVRAYTDAWEIHYALRALLENRSLRAL